MTARWVLRRASAPGNLELVGSVPNIRWPSRLFALYSAPYQPFCCRLLTEEPHVKHQGVGASDEASSQPAVEVKDGPNIVVDSEPTNEVAEQVSSDAELNEIGVDEPSPNRVEVKLNAEQPFVCECFAPFRKACKGRAFFGEAEGKRYCVLHYPGTEKAGAFRAAFLEKIRARDFNFRGLWFPDEVGFNNFEFGVDAHFARRLVQAQSFFP